MVRSCEVDHSRATCYTFHFRDMLRITAGGGSLPMLEILMFYFRAIMNRIEFM